MYFIHFLHCKCGRWSFGKIHCRLHIDEKYIIYKIEKLYLLHFMMVIEAFLKITCVFVFNSHSHYQLNVFSKVDTFLLNTWWLKLKAESVQCYAKCNHRNHSNLKRKIMYCFFVSLLHMYFSCDIFYTIFNMPSHIVEDILILKYK